MTRLALLFDLDGTLVDTDHLHHRAFATLFAEDGRDLTIAQYKAEIMGQPNAAIRARFYPDDPDRGAAVIARKEALFREWLEARIEPVKGIRALLDWAEAEGVGTAVVTNAPRVNAAAMLAAAGLAERLRVLVIGEECLRPKPDPLPYGLAMSLLGAAPSMAVAFEDSRSGLRAARGSGAHVFGLTTGLTPEALLAAGAHQTISDFTDPALWAFLEERKARAA